MLNRQTGISFLGVCVALLLVAGCSVESRKASHTRRAEEYLAEGRLDRAEIEYLNVLRLDPKAGDPLGKLGLIYFEQGQLGRALPYLARAIEINGKDLTSRAKLASLLLSVGNRTQAATEAEKILEQDPGHPEAIVMLAECASTPDEIRKVMDRLDRAGEGRESSAAAWAARGILLAKEGKPGDALQALTKAVEIDDAFAPAHSALAALHVAREQTAQAEREFARASELAGPRSPKTLQYALFKARSGDVPGARRILEDVIKQAPDYVPAVLRLADVMAKEGQYAEAEKVLQPILTRVPNHPEALLVRSRIYLAEGRPDKAGVDVDLLTRMYPNSPEAHFEAARVFLAKGDPARALDSLHLAIEANPEYWDAILLKARVHLNQGEAVMAGKLLTGLLEKQPANGDALFLLVDAWRAQKNLSAALETCDTLERYHPNREAVAYLRGELLRQLNRPVEARAAFEQALIRDPNSVRALDELVILDVQDRHLEQAVARVEAEVRRRPDVAGLRTTLGKLNLIRRDPARAEEQLKQAVMLDPKSSLAHVLLARLYLDTDRQDLAIASLVEVVALNPRDEGAAMLLASLYEKRGDIGSARKAYENLIQAVPNAAPALNNLACLLEKHTKELERAYELARRARELLPGDASVADTLGWILYRKGEYKLALSMLRESSAKAPAAAEAHHRLGMVLYLLGSEKEALAELSQAVRLGLTADGREDAVSRISILELRAGGAEKADDAVLRARLAAHPSDPLALITRGDFALARGQPDQAMESYHEAALSSPQNGLAQMGLARAEFARGNTSPALDYARDARTLMPESVDALALLGRLAFASGDFTWANTLLQDAFRQRATDPSIALDAARAAYSQGRIEDALRVFAVVAARSPTKDLEEQVELIRAQAGGAPYAASVVALARVRLRSHPEDVPSLMVVAGAGEAGETAQALETVLKLYPDFAPAKRELALFLARQSEKNDDRVVKIASQALDVYHGDLALVKVLALSTARLGRYQVALPLLERAVEANKSDAKLWYYLGVTRQGVGSRDSARTALETAVQLGGLSSELAEDARKRIERLRIKDGE